MIEERGRHEGEGEAVGKSSEATKVGGADEGEGGAADKNREAAQVDEAGAAGEPGESGVSEVRLRLDLRYDGTYFHGWAKQDGLRTVQGELEAALSTILRVPANLTVAGRTDAGVHALSQVAHFDLQGEEDPATTPDGPIEPPTSRSSDRPRKVLSDMSPAALAKFTSRVNGLLAARYSALWRPLTESGRLPRTAYSKGDCDVVVTSVRPVDKDFDARFSAIGRAYRYQLVDSVAARNPIGRDAVWWTATGALDVNLMNQAAALLVGEHDFLSFCKPREGATTIRTLRRLDVTHEGGTIAVEVEADAFCHSMVRSLVGALVEVGRGARAVAWAGELVANPSRGHGVPVAPARGLSLLGVEYPPSDQWGSRARAARNVRTLTGQGDC